jgi:hypothetical protein
MIGMQVFPKANIALRHADYTSACGLINHLPHRLALAQHLSRSGPVSLSAKESHASDGSRLKLQVDAGRAPEVPPMPPRRMAVRLQPLLLAVSFSANTSDF